MKFYPYNAYAKLNKKVIEFCEKESVDIEKVHISYDASHDCLLALCQDKVSGKFFAASVK